MEKVVLSLGGSLMNPGKIDIEYLKKIRQLILKLKSKYHFAILCGGGAPAREYAKAVREFQGNEFLSDEAAIMLTRANAFLMVAVLGKEAYPNALDDFTKAAEASVTDKIIVMGGTIPGFTTDADAALLAEKFGAKKLVNLSNVEAIYSEDPKKNPKAKRFSSLTHEALIRLANENDLRTAGTNFVFDNIACKIVGRSGVEVHFVKGTDLKQVEAAITGKPHNGTVVRD